MSVVGSSLFDSKACPSCNFSGGDLIRQRPSNGGGKHAPRLELGTSFLDYSSMRALWSGNNSLRKQRKSTSLAVVDNLGGQYEDNFEDVKNVR